MDYITLAELNRQIKTVLSDGITPNIWVVAEIAAIKMAGSGGHWYLDLVEKNQANISAKSNGVIWAGTYNLLRQKFGSDLPNLLKAGNKILLRGSVDYHEVYGLKIIMTDIDPSITMGELELRRLATIQRLTAEEHIGRNGKLPMPSVLQRIAVISSATAAGYGDFMNHTSHNPYGYRLHTTLFPSLMQGDGVEQELIAQLEVIGAQRERFDAVVIIRGGGSKLDLEAFNNYQIAVAIANCPLPVLTGIGHQQDETVADMVAHTSLKTPTAVAEYILQTFMVFESAILTRFAKIEKLSGRFIQQHNYRLQTATTRLQSLSKQKLQQNSQHLQTQLLAISRAAKRYLQNHEMRLNHLEQATKLINIDALLKRGFTITRHHGKAVSSSAKLQKGDLLSTQFSDGEVDSRVE